MNVEGAQEAWCFHLHWILYLCNLKRPQNLLDFILIRSLFEVEFESVTYLFIWFETYRSGMFLDSRGDFAGLGMASLEFDDYAHVVW